MEKQVYDLRVNSLINPLGVDKTPYFSWKTKSQTPASMQSAYRITVFEDLNLQTIVWDTGFVSSSDSIGIHYTGTPLIAEHRYFWQVTLRDEENTEYKSSTAFFETGLMCNSAADFGGAVWIGNNKKTVNTGGVTHYRLNLDFSVSGGACGIILNARNRDNYILFEADTQNRLVKVFEQSDNAWSGSYAQGVRPCKKPCGKSCGYEIPEMAIRRGEESNTHHMELEINGGAVKLLINGVTIIDEENIIEKEQAFCPYKRRLFLFGFKQDMGIAVYENLKLDALGTTNITLIDDDFNKENTKCSALGEIKDGKLIVRDRFSLINPAPAIKLRTLTDINKEIKSARMYAAARGFYDLFINGKRINRSFYNPGFTDYRLRLQYKTYDITEHLKEGKNSIGVSLGNGYYSGFTGYNSMPMVYGEQPSFLAKIVIRYLDGTSDVIVTDSSWQFTDCGAVIYDDYLNGEIYNAMLETDWFDNSWKPCGVFDDIKTVIPTNGSFSEEITPMITAEPCESAEIFKEIKAEYIGEAAPGHFIYDIGQNIVGTIRVRVKGKSGTAIKFRYGEMCYKNGELYIKNLRSASNTDVYIMNGSADGEEFIPSLTSHGFRYVEVTGEGSTLYDNNIIEEIYGLVITNTREINGNFECSNALVNKLYSNIVWGQRGNSLLVYTDCPQRNERMGWTGDAQAFARTAAYNMNIRAFMDKWLTDLRDAQLMYNKNGAVPDTAPLGGDNRADGCAGWGDAAVIVPWEMYRAYGDIKILEENYPMMEKWIGYIMSETHRNHGERIVNGKAAVSDTASQPYIQVQQRRGDHLTFDKSTPYILSATAYSAYVTDIMAKVSEILGRDGKYYADLHEKIKYAFNEAWVKEDGSIAYWGEMSEDGINATYYCESSENKPSQTAYVLALRFNLIDKEKEKNTAAFLNRAVERADGCLTTGFLGISHLNPALTAAGYSDTAYKLLLQEKNPSWLYSVKNGATTIWERWNSYIAETDTFGEVSMNSFNHYSYGAVGEWLFESVLGISPIEAGYKKIKIAPIIGGGLKYAKGYHNSPYGIIESGWEIQNGKTVLKCTIPANTTAEVHFGGKIYNVGSGKHEFVSE